MPRPEPSPRPAQWSDAALVLIGHGSALNPNTSRATREQAQAIAARGLFADVRCGFWKETPFLAECLDGITARRVYVVPNLACKGYITAEVMPREMGLAGPITRRGGREIVLCDPVGTHPAMADLIGDRACSIMTEHGLDPEDTCLVLVGHGSSRNRQSSIQTQAVAERLAAERLAADVRTAFLEHPPLVQEWHDDTKKGNVIVIPFMISNGLHGAEDVPRLLGIDPADPDLALLSRTGQPAGPYALSGRRLWYCRPIGCEGRMTEVILDCIAAADSVA